MGLIEQVFKYSRIKRSGLTGAVADDLDDLASEFPQLGAGVGIYYASGAGSVSYASLSFTVPSGKLFHLKNIDIIAGAAQLAPVFFFDGPGYSAPKYFVLHSQMISNVIHYEGIRGVVFQSIPMFSTSATMVNCKIGGLIRERGSEA